MLRTRSILLATPVHVASRITSGIERRISSILSEVHSTPLAVIHRAGTHGAGLIPGFGVLVPRGQGIRTLGIQFSGSLFEGRMPTDTAWLHTHFVGGALDEGVVDLGDDEIIELTRSEADRILPTPLCADWSEVTRYPHAIPQLDPGHPQRLDALRDALREVPGLETAGSYVGGVGLDGAVDSGICAASRLSGWLDKQGTRGA
jgi:oxygen-dependent protoporphyrinogen oxidase